MAEKKTVADPAEPKTVDALTPTADDPTPTKTAVNNETDAEPVQNAAATDADAEPTSEPEDAPNDGNDTPNGGE